MPEAGMRRAEPEDLTGDSLTDRQRKIMQVIEDSVRLHGYPPTLREIGDATGLASTSSVSHQLMSLQKKGYVSRGAGRPRSAVVRPVADPEPAPSPEPDQAYRDLAAHKLTPV